MISNQAFAFTIVPLILLALVLVVRRTVRDAPRCADCHEAVVVNAGDACGPCTSRRRHPAGKARE